MTKRPWADHPFKLLSVPSAENVSPQTRRVATEMCLAHNSFILTLNSIYLQAPNLTSSTDISDFILYCQFWCETISHHHDYEERWFFPAIEEYSGQKGIMDANLRQHEAFHSGLEHFERFVKGYGSEGNGEGKEEGKEVEKWDGGKKLLRIVDGFSEALVKHLGEEIECLLGLEKFGGEKLLGAWIDLEKKIMAEVTDKSKVIPFALGGIDRTFEGGKYKYWPPFPWFVPYLVGWVFMRKYKGSWRFSPCTVHGVPRELPFVKFEE